MTTRNSPTPWGPAQHLSHLGSGVHLIDTAGHGGLFVPHGTRTSMPAEVVDIVLNEPGWASQWAEEDCHLPIAMAFIYPNLDPHTVTATFPAVARSGLDPHTFWIQTAIRTAGHYDSLRPCVPYLQDLIPSAQESH